ncbi:MAG: exonuclease subunit SbcD [Treponema sp.]|jgi:exonuclease SbcD|nr:exonuclease subunit SbcD [Treponema sp.]
MVKFLHTADLHLGKVFHDHSLLEDQAFMLDQLGGILSDKSYSALLIAGDIYDRSIPSPEAVALFGAFLEKMCSIRPDLVILILPGNHDSAPRLGFGRELFAKLDIHIAAEPERAFEPVLVKNPGETCAFFLLPFLYPGCLCGGNGLAGSGEAPDPAGPGSPAPGDPVRSQSRLAEIAAARLETARAKAVKAGAVLTVLGAHLFTLGGRESESERIFLGTAEQVDANLFSGFDYTALGHLHRFQKIGSNAWYSGSPLAYSFGEADQEKVFLSVELDPVGAALPRVIPIPVRPLWKLRRLWGSFNFFFGDSAEDPVIIEAEKDYLEISLDDTTLVENPLALLRPRFPRLLSIRQETAFARLAAGNSGVTGEALPHGGSKRSPSEDFADFLSGIYGEADPEKLALFGELLSELEEGMEK